MAFILTVIIIILDQASKSAAIKYLKHQRPKVIIENFLQLNYVENRGAAFGILQGKRVLFLIITIAVVLIITFYLVKYYNQMNTFTRISFAMLIGGAIGNLIDRIRLGYVVDFISVKLLNLYDFPVFNVADICVVISTIFIVYLVLFDKLEIGDLNGLI
ncbi:MAG: signal peptidase II [Tissierellaceae bacterium]|nr:signal peptidase II [Tissierellaceae bacterium]